MLRYLACILIPGFIMGCAINPALDTANVGAEKVGEPVGKVIKLPQSVMEGTTKGYVDKPKQENPYGR